MTKLPPTHGPVVCHWIEDNLVHGEGDFYGQPFRLTREQKRLIYRLYEYDPTTGLPLRRRALFGRPKGYGKTEIAAALAVEGLAGPTAPIAPDIPVAAASFEQADLLFGAAKVQIEEGPLKPYFECYDTEILRKDGAGRIYRVAAVAGTNDGGRHSRRFADEIHEWLGRKEKVHVVLTNGLAKRAGSQGIDTTTAGSDDPTNPTTLAGRLYAKGKAIERGEITDDAFLFDWLEHPDPNCELDTEEKVWAAARIAYANAGEHVDLEQVVARFYEIEEFEWRRYYLNQFTLTAEVWLPTGAWARLADTERGLPSNGAPVILGFDGSYNGDSTGIYGWDLTDPAKPHGFVLGCWEKPDRAGDNWVVPRDEVVNTVEAAMKRWRVRHLVCDPPYWHREIEEWAVQYGSSVVVKFETNRSSLMGPACSKFYRAVRTEALSHDGDPRANRHLANARTRETPNGAVIGKEHRHSKKKCDLGIAAVIGYDLAVGEPEPEPFVLSTRW